MIVTGSLKAYFYFCQIRGQRPDLLIELVESLKRILNGEWREQYLPVGAENTAVMFILSDIDTNVDRREPPLCEMDST